jgi:hypothetical protein
MKLMVYIMLPLLKESDIMEIDKMKTIKYSATEKHTDFLLQVIGTDNLDNYMRTLIERDIEERTHHESKKLNLAKFTVE